MDEEEPNVNIWGEISDSELVLESAKVEQNYEKQQEQRRFTQWFSEKLRRKLKISVIVKKQIDHYFPWSTLLQTIEMTP